MAYWRLRLKLLSTARSILVISCFITGVHLAQRVPRRQSIDKDRKRTQVTEMMGKGLRDGRNHGVEESWRKLKRSHRWWVRWTRLLRSRGGPTLISARLFSAPPSPLHFRGLRFRKAVCWKRDCVSREYGEREAQERAETNHLSSKKFHPLSAVRNPSRWGDGKQRMVFCPRLSTSLGNFPIERLVPSRINV